MNARDGETEGGEFRNLVLHECDQRADDEGGAAARNSWKLEAKGFAGAGRHDQKHVLPGDGGAADDFLIDPESREAEAALQQVKRGFAGLREDRCHRGEDNKPISTRRDLAMTRVIDATASMNEMCLVDRGEIYSERRTTLVG